MGVGSRATRSAALALGGTPLGCSPGSASISAVNRTAAASLGIRAKVLASRQRSTLRRASGQDAERRPFAILADRRAEELVELESDQRRQRGVGHDATPLETVAAESARSIARSRSDTRKGF